MIENDSCGAHAQMAGKTVDNVEELEILTYEGKEHMNARLLDQQAEVLSLVGDVALEKGKPKIHAHAVVGLADGSTRGHLIEAHVWPTLEVVVSQSPAHLQRMTDPETGLALVQVEA